MRTILELEIINTETKERKTLSVEAKLLVCPNIGHMVIVKNEWHRIVDIIQDSDHEFIYVRFEPRYETICYDDAIKKYVENGWRML